MENGYPGLQKNWHRLGLPQDPVILVPLAGKSKDILWLSQYSAKVIAVEISEIAIQQFFGENGLMPSLETYAGFKLFSSKNITFWQGDFMKLPQKKLPPIDLIYDKASIVALPPSKRNLFVEKLISISTKQTRILMHLLSYPESDMTGPPFSLTLEEIQELFACRFKITELERNELDLKNYKKFRQRGLKSNFFEILLLLSQNKSI